MFPIVDATQWTVDEVDEQLGTKEKWWLDGRRRLFKQVRETAQGSPGEDWAEKVVEQLGLRLGLPMAEVDLAHWDGRRGIVSQSFVATGERLEHGNELLVRVDPDYDMDQGRRNERYTVSAVQQALAEVQAPLAYQVEQLTAFDVWAGYLLLDAFVGGRDRHHENWGVIVGTDHRRVLAPSFDHGNALGFQESEARYAALAADPERLKRWAERGKSHHFAGGPTLVALAHEARQHMSSGREDVWMTRLAALDTSVVDHVLSEVPNAIMSVDARTFCRSLLELNRGRIVDGHQRF